jgi:DNA-binding CsgD family transcriptional regulator
MRTTSWPCKSAGRWPGSPTPPRWACRPARQILACLLEGDGDKQVATRLNISRFTVNQYTKMIFQHFGVQSRPELLARWIRRGHRLPFTWAEERGNGLPG